MKKYDPWKKDITGPMIMLATAAILLFFICKK